MPGGAVLSRGSECKVHAGWAMGTFACPARQNPPLLPLPLLPLLLLPQPLPPPRSDCCRSLPLTALPRCALPQVSRNWLGEVTRELQFKLGEGGVEARLRQQGVRQEGTFALSGRALWC